MKTKVFYLTAILALSVQVWSQGIGINETGSNAHSSAALDVDFNNKGFLPPRLTTAQRNAIVAPAVGLTIFNITTNCLQWFVGNSWHDACSENLYQQYPAGANFCGFQPTLIVDVINPTTGATWMDRNLGASRAAISIDDAEAYGSLFQWGRFSDGHQCVNRYTGDGVTTSGTTTTLSSSDTPGHGDFITFTAPTGNFDWRSPQNVNLWQGVNGINNPCPLGYRLPTQTEFVHERDSWISEDINGAFASPLKFSASGFRNASGNFQGINANGRIWSSTVFGTNSRSLNYGPSNGNPNASSARVQGFSVRCIKD